MAVRNLNHLTGHDPCNGVAQRHSCDSCAYPTGVRHRVVCC
jgi:hypothetical protein